MRPRVFPAEDRPVDAGRAARATRFNEAAGIPRGRRPPRPGGSTTPKASMRPRVFPAEDAQQRMVKYQTDLASMRPRVFPAEDPPRRPWPSTRRARFNEAAGIPRGRHRRYRDRRGGLRRASMRPRVFPAEDAAVRRDRGGPGHDASMRPRVFPAEDMACTPPQSSSPTVPLQ